MSAWHWVGRAVCAAITFGLSHLRAEHFAPTNNLPSVAITACLSALCNACGVIAAYVFTRGRVSYDLQRLAFCAIVVNLLSVIAYAAKSSPFVSVTNLTITVISYAQFIRLLWPTNGGIFDFRRGGPVHGRDDLSHEGLYMEKKK